ncbi:MAG TPA: alpha-hydroxy-acid oxidizing protein, partial [Clostridia bacterium]|nr:alpha-hydroxy-acid oxidizing protein [Clostridia bacterium]
MEKNQMPPPRPGDANRITREYLDSLLIEMRHLDGVLPSTKMELYGRGFGTPVMMAAFSHLDAFHYHDDGMAEIARAAYAANALNWAGMGSEEELERILATGAATIKIIKPYRDN